MVRSQDRKFVSADPEKCVGCGICEYVCSMYNEKAFNPAKSRIRTIRVSPLANMPVTCRHCEDPSCVSACPRNALKQEENTGIIRVDENSCNGCGWCIEACQFGAMNLHPTRRVAFTCNSCTDNQAKEPQCVKWCPEEALSYVNAERLTQKYRHRAVKSLFQAAGKIS